MKQFSWEAEHKKMETHVGNRTLFMLHGDECAHMKGKYFVERIQINMIFAAALHILLLLLWGRGDSFTACFSRPLQFRCKLIVTES